MARISTGGWISEKNVSNMSQKALEAEYWRLFPLRRDRKQAALDTGLNWSDVDTIESRMTVIEDELSRRIAAKKQESAPVHHVHTCTFCGTGLTHEDKAKAKMGGRVCNECLTSMSEDEAVELLASESLVYL